MNEQAPTSQPFLDRSAVRWAIGIGGAAATAAVLYVGSHFALEHRDNANQAFEDRMTTYDTTKAAELKRTEDKEWDKNSEVLAATGAFAIVSGGITIGLLVRRGSRPRTIAEAIDLPPLSVLLGIRPPEEADNTSVDNQG